MPQSANFSINDAGVARDAVAITPSDSTDITSGPVRGLWVGTAGNVALITFDGSTATLVNAFGVIPLSVKRVLSTGTTASNIVGLW
jgi:hypothetical protein